MIEIIRAGKIIKKINSQGSGVIEIGKNTLMDITHVESKGTFNIKIGDNNLVTGYIKITNTNYTTAVIKHNNILENLTLDGRDIKIGSKCTLKNVKLSRRVSIKNNVFISNTSIGSFTKVHPHAIIMNAVSVASVCIIENHAKIFGKIELESSVIGAYKKCYRFELRKGISSGIYYDESHRVIVVGNGELNAKKAADNERILNAARRLLKDYKDLDKCYEYLN